MDESTRPARVRAILSALFPVGLALQLVPAIRKVADLVQKFRTSDPTPQSTCDF